MNGSAEGLGIGKTRIIGHENDDVGGILGQMVFGFAPLVLGVLQGFAGPHWLTAVRERVKRPGR